MSNEVNSTQPIKEDESIVLLRRIANDLEKQNNISSKLLLWNKILLSVVAALIVFIMMAILVVFPKIMPILDNSNELLLEMTSLLEDASTIIAEIEKIDFEATSTQLTELIVESTDKIDAIDIETLNKAIQDFSTTVEPIAKLFGR